MTAKPKLRQLLKGANVVHKPHRSLEPVELDDFLPFLITRAASRIITYFNKATDWTDLTLADARALGAIWRLPGIRLVDLSKVTDIELSTLSRLVRRLERRKLCTIETRDRDARVGSIRLSSSGLQIMQDFASVGRHIEKLLVRDLTAQEGALLKVLLRKASVDLTDQETALN
jgi:DNA-binding MarR family transcriptional regulator